MNGSAAAAPPNMAGHRRKGLMHMTFFWGTDSLILFSGWPGRSTAMYAVALLLTFLVAFLVEFLSGCRLIRPEMSHVAAALAQTSMHAIRMGLAYLVMLALMSFNGGVFIAAVAGHTVGFWLFRIRRKSERPPTPNQEKVKSDLPPMSC